MAKLVKYEFDYNDQHFSFEAPEGLKEADLVSIAEENTPQPESKSLMRSIGESVVEDAPEIAGSMAGEALGLAVGGPKGAIIGGGVGQAVGGLAKDMTRNPKETGLALAETAGAASTAISDPAGTVRTISDNPRVQSFLKERGQEFATGAAGSVIGAGAAKLVSKAISPFKKSVLEGAKEIRGLFQKFGSDLTPAQATDNAGLDLLEGALQNSLTSQGTMNTFKAGQEQAGRQVVEAVVNELAGDVSNRLGQEGVGELFLQTAKRGAEAHDALTNGLYANVDELSKGTWVSTLDLKKAAQNIQNELKILGKLGKTAEITDALSGIRNLPEEMPFSHAHMVRSELLKKVRALKANPEKAQSLARVAQLAEAAHGMMENGAGALNGDAVAAWKLANATYKEGKEVFENSFMANLIVKNKVQPSKIGETIFRNGNVDEVRKAKKALERASQLDPSINFGKTWKAMKAGYLEDVLARHTTPDGNVDGAGMMKEFIQKRSSRTLEEAFSEHEFRELERLARAMKKSQTNPAASIPIKMAQVLGGFQLLTSQFRDDNKYDTAANSAALGLLIAPAVLARLVVSPTGRKLLTEGFEMTGKQKLAAQGLPSFFTKLTVAAFQEREEQGNLNR